MILYASQIILKYHAVMTFQCGIIVVVSFLGQGVDNSFDLHA